MYNIHFYHLYKKDQQYYCDNVRYFKYKPQEHIIIKANGNDNYNFVFDGKFYIDNHNQFIDLYYSCAKCKLNYKIAAFTSELYWRIKNHKINLLFNKDLIMIHNELTNEVSKIKFKFKSYDDFHKAESLVEDYFLLL